MKTAQIADLKSDAAAIIGSLAQDLTVVLTEQDQPAAYLVEASAYEAQQERLRILEGIARGEQALANGQTFSHEEAKARLAKWLA